MKRQLVLAILLLGTLVSGCGKQIADFVSAVPRKAVIPSTPSGPAEDRGHKISPGANASAGNTLISQHAITTTKREATGTTLKSKFSFHRNRAL